MLRQEGQRVAELNGGRSETGQMAILNRICLQTELPAPSGASPRGAPMQHLALSAAPESRGLKGPFQPSAFGSLFYL